jgi:hypothetical protein
MAYAKQHRRELKMYVYVSTCRSQLLRGLRHEMSSPARTLGSWVRILLKAWMFALIMCDGLVTRPRSPTDCLRIKKLK